MKTRSRFPAAALYLVTGTALFIILNFLIYYLYNGILFRYMPADPFVYHYKISEIKSGKLKDVRILLLGDSQIQSAVDPRLLSEITGKSVWNAGLPAMQPEGIEIMLPDLLDAAAKTEAVILGIGAYSLLETDNYNAYRKYSDELFFCLARPGNFFLIPQLIAHRKNPLTLLPLLKAGSLTAEIANPLHALSVPPDVLIRFPQLASAEEIRSLTETPHSLKERMALRNRKNEETAFLLERNLGRWTWNSTVQDEETFRSAEGCSAKHSPLDLPVKAVFRKRPGAEESWIRIIGFLQRRDIRTIVIQIPFSPQWKNKAGPQAAALADQSFDKITSGFGGLVTLSEKNIPELAALAERGIFFDITHLSPCGALQYTENLGSALKNLKIFP